MIVNNMDECISRKDAIDALKAIKYGLWEIDIPSPGNSTEYKEHHRQIQDMMGVVDNWIDKLSELPSIYNNPMIPKGKWLEDNRGYFYCSECGDYPNNQRDKTNYCPICGADMRGGEDENCQRKK